MKKVTDQERWKQEAARANFEIAKITKAGFFTRLKWLFTGVTTDHEINLDIEGG